MAYREQTAPLIAYYRRHGVLRSVDGMASIPEVAAQIENALAEVGAGATPKPPRGSAKPKTARPKAKIAKAKPKPAISPRKPRIGKKSKVRGGAARKPVRATRQRAASKPKFKAKSKTRPVKRRG
jgi:adenylate kinase